jgi:uncharacterized membrane protein
MATSLILHSIIVLADDPRWKRRRDSVSWVVLPLIAVHVTVVAAIVPAIVVLDLCKSGFPSIPGLNIEEVHRSIVK